MGRGVWYSYQATPDKKKQNGMSCHPRRCPNRILSVDLSSKQLKALGVGVWVVLGEGRGVDRNY